MYKVKILFFALLPLVLGACNAAILAGSASKIGYNMTSNPEEFGGIKTVTAESPEAAMVKLNNQEAYKSFPASIQGENFNILLTGKDDNNCLYSAVIPQGKNKSPDYQSIKHYKVCGKDVAEIDSAHEKFPANKQDRNALMDTHIKSWESTGNYAFHHAGDLHIQEFIYSQNIATECAESVVSVIRGVRLVEHTTTKTCKPELRAYIPTR